MKQEIEYKLDVPLESSEYELFFAACLLASGMKYHPGPWREFTRRFTYYDTQTLDFYRNGWTARMVEGFDPKKSPGTYRYDLKI